MMRHACPVKHKTEKAKFSRINYKEIDNFVILIIRFCCAFSDCNRCQIIHSGLIENVAPCPSHPSPLIHRVFAHHRQVIDTQTRAKLVASAQGVGLNARSPPPPCLTSRTRQRNQSRIDAATLAFSDF
ncbi:hypothetical protein JOB18_049657 [Solea senegalensis]|uniref:Uncharacterized protein n=1 Tax=Solea senegalensis TaxID=28829 RepID=A0AAV6QFH7_SOLSE|nr:hypothetical protein JOB18_049657 [Solea senegalensis]